MSTDSGIADAATSGRPRHRRKLTTMRTVSALMLREMSTRYGKSPGGYVWAILEPLGAILILGFGFSLIIKSPALGSSFLLFYATGYLPFHLYQSLSGVVMRGIFFSHSLLFYPVVTWVDALLARFILNALTGILVFYLLMLGITFVLDIDAIIEMEPVLWSTLLALFLGLGVGTLNCALYGLFPVWDVVWSILTRPLFLASGIFFTYDGLPQTAQAILWYNPLVHIVGLMRSGFYPMYPAHYADSVFVLAVSAVTLFFGVLLLRRYHRTIITER